MDEGRFLAGPKEVGLVLDVDANTVNVWQQRDGAGFPAPIVRLAGCAVWDIRDVIAWADATGRTVQNRDYVAPGWLDPAASI